MKRYWQSFCLSAVAWALLPAGCPLEPTSGTGSVPSSSGSGDWSYGTSGGRGAGGTTAATGTSGESGTGGSAVGPAASGGSSSTGGSSNSELGSANVGGRPSPVAAGGNVLGGTAVSDGLSVEFPGCDEPVEADYWRAEIIRLVNQRRAAAGIGTVTLNRTLQDEATQYACELIYYSFFDHVNPTTGSTLRDRAADFNYDYWIIGENLAAGQRSPIEALTAWMDSPCHRENILNPAFTELGVGVRVGGHYGYYWVQEFGRPLTLTPYPGPPYKDPQCSHDE